MQNVRGVIGITSGKFNGANGLRGGIGGVGTGDNPVTAVHRTADAIPGRGVAGLRWGSGVGQHGAQPGQAAICRAVAAGQLSMVATSPLDATANIDPLNQERSTYALQLNVENVQLQAIARANQWRERLFGEIRGFVSLRGVGSDPSEDRD